MKFSLKMILAAAVFAGVAVSDSTSFTIHVVGDSTVCTYKDNAYPQTGWGQVNGLGPSYWLFLRWCSCQGE